MQNIRLFSYKLTKKILRSRQFLLGKSSKYDTWVKTHETPLNKKYVRQNPFTYNPKISIIIPVWNTDELWLHLAIQSVLNQYYDNWELCISDGNSTNPNIKKILQRYSMKDKRIKTVFLNENEGIAGNTNAALSLAERYICLLFGS